jgi:hypothetical protein
VDYIALCPEDGTALLATCFMLGSFFDPEDGDDMFSQIHLLTLNILKGVISQKMKLKCAALFMEAYEQEHIRSKMVPCLSEFSTCSMN